METLHERIQAARLTPSRAALGALRFADALNRNTTLSHLMRAIDPGGAAAFSAQVLRRFATLADPRLFAADIAQRYATDEAAAPATTLPFRVPPRSDLPSGAARWVARRAAGDSAPLQPDTGALTRVFDAPVDPVPSPEPPPSLLDELSARGWGGPPHQSGARVSSETPAMPPHPAEAGDRPATPSTERTMARQPAASAPEGIAPIDTAPVARARERQPAAPAPEGVAPPGTPPIERMIASQSTATDSLSGASPDTMRISRAPHTTPLLRESRRDPIGRMGIAPPDAPSWSPAFSSGGETLAPLPLRRTSSVERSAAPGTSPFAPPEAVSRSPDGAAPSLPHQSPHAASGSDAAPGAATPAADGASQEGSTPGEPDTRPQDATPAPTSDTLPAAGAQISPLDADLSRATAPVPEPAAWADASSTTPAAESRSSAPAIQRSPQPGSAPGLRPSPLHLPTLIARRYHLVWREGEVQQMPLLRPAAPPPVRAAPATAYRTPGRSASAAISPPAMRSKDAPPTAPAAPVFARMAQPDAPAMRSTGAPLIDPAAPAFARGTPPDAPVMPASGDAPDLRDPSVAPLPGFAPPPLPLARTAAPDPSSETTIGRAAPARLVERSASREAGASRLADGMAGVRAAAVPLVSIQRTIAGWQPFAAHAAEAFPLSAAGSAPAAESPGWLGEERRVFHESARQPDERAAIGSAETFAYRSPFADTLHRSGAGQQSRHTELTVARRADTPAEAERFAPAPAPALDMITPRRTTAPVQSQSIYRAVDDPSATPQTMAGAEQPHAGAAPSPPQDIEKIAQQVYDHLRRRLLIDQERRGRMF